MPNLEKTGDRPESEVRDSVVRGPLWYVAAISSVAYFMVQFDNSVVSIALPSIQRSLSLDVSGLQWVVNSYSLALAGLLLLSGRLSDLFGRREVFLAGLWLFTFGSVLGGFAQNGWELVAARASHGVSSAILLPSSLGLIIAAYPEKHRRNRAISIWGAASIIGGVTGAVLGGVLTHHWGWRSTLFFCLPIGCVLLAFGTRTLTRQVVAARAGIPSLDLPGALCVVSSVTAAVYATIGLKDHAWLSAHTILSFAVSIVFLVAFLLIESRSKHPMVPLGIFRSRTISMANLVSFVATVAMASQVILVVLYIQKVLGYDPQEAGLAELPGGLTTFLVAILTARFVKRIGARPMLIVGLLVYAAGVVWIARVPVHGDYWGAIFFPMELLCLGMGLTMPCLTITATAGAPKDSAGLYSGVATTTRQIGSAIGVAMFTSIAATVSMSATGSKQTVLASGYRTALLGCAGVAVVAAVLALAIPGERRQTAQADARVDVQANA
ncbi:EmrB/QacA subfamily drug resistance transporter [Kitasatospora sp. MAA19]|uniref:MFS transporter n=1 Tax=unclassified Kitasatospora TaxID=2633591 RepID=UPI002473162D|nr:MFS transporter [Kitasatospora sp. MAA19]MDH6707193.1 EmrB/QacA subfamily drug resistance transporter [Kitasatospora sp. MAA19]